MIAQQQLLLGQDPLEIFDFVAQIAIFVFEFFTFEAGQAAEAHVDDMLGLAVAETEALDQAFLGLVLGFGTADDGDDLVDMVDRNAQAFDDMAPGFGFFQVEEGPAPDDVFLVVEIMLQGFQQIDDLGLETAHFVRNQRQHVGVERILQLGVFVELVQDDIGIGVFFQLDDDPDGVVAVGFVAQIARCPRSSCP